MSGWTLVVGSSTMSPSHTLLHAAFRAIFAYLCKFPQRYQEIIERFSQMLHFPLEILALHHLIYVPIDIPLHGLLYPVSLSLRFWIIVNVSLERHNVKAFTCFAASSLLSLERLEYDSHCVHQAPKSLPLSM